MSKTIRIPRSYGFPEAKFYINGVEYKFPTEKDVRVEDEIASALEESIKVKAPKEELPYYIETTVGNFKRFLPETSSDGGKITDPEFAELLVQNFAKAKYYSVYDDTKEIAPDFTPTITTQGVYVTAYIGSSMYVQVDTSKGVVRMYNGTGGGGGTIVIPDAVITKYRPVLSKPYVKLFTNGMDGYIYIDAGQKIKATCKYLEEIHKSGKNVIVDLNGIREYADHIESSYDSSVNGVVWKTSRCGKAVDSIA